LGLAVTSDTIQPRFRRLDILPRLRVRLMLQCPAGSGEPSIEIPQKMEPKVPECGVRSEQPAVTVVDLSDPAVAGQNLELVDLDAVQLTSTPFRARRVVVRLEEGAVVYHSTNHRVRTRTRAQADRLSYVVYGPLTRGTVNGVPVRPDRLLAVEPATEVVSVTDAEWESIMLLLPPAALRAHVRDRGRGEDFRLPHGAETLQADAAMVRQLFDWGKRLVDVAARQPALFNDRKDERGAAQVEMVEALLATLGAARAFEPARTDHVRQSRILVVKAAEDYALSHVDERIYVTDLCRAAAVSERALEYAFKEVMGLTPVAYLIRLRLHRVRQALLAGTHGSTTVSEVALDWGFWHFGEFSRAYKGCFGELPSDTLRGRPSADQR
jgi:AraC family transcriptional regulator, ethanolamine operon transcriptional activator